MRDLRETSAGTVIGVTASRKIGFHGATPSAQRAGAAQAAVSTTTLTVGATYDQTEVTALKTRCADLTTLVNELRAALVAKGIIKGAA